MNDKIVLPVTYTVNNIVDNDDTRFLSISIDVLHTGLNLNGSIFTKEIVDSCAESIKNTPVLGFIAENPDGNMDFQGHEYKQVQTSHGYEEIYAGQPYGIIPESCNYRWELRECDDGEAREYFVVDALLWTKFKDAVSIFNRDGGSKPQSMELELSSITGTQDEETGVFTFSSFKFDGCCLLSSTDPSIQPAMIGSTAHINYTAECFASEIKNKLAEYMKLLEIENDKQEGDLMPNPDFAMSLEQQKEEISNAVSEEKMTDRWGYTCSRYYYYDIQDDEVIVIDCKDHYRLYGMRFSFNGDACTVDFENKTRKKIVFENYEDGETVDNDVYEDIISGYSEFMDSKCEEIQGELDNANTKFSEIQGQYDEMKPKYDAYVVEEQKREAEAIESAKMAEFAKFDAHLSNVEGYEDLKKNHADYSLEDIKSKCAILFTEKSLAEAAAKSTEFTLNDKNHKEVPMVSTVFTDSGIDELSARYGDIPLKD